MSSAALAPGGLSVVLELDNLRLAPRSRLGQLLDRLRGEFADCAAELADPVELIVCCDSQAGDPAALAPALAGILPGRLRCRFLRLHALDYYQTKNAGAATASGELLLFVDGDVLPEPGWLRAMLGPFRRAEVEVVTGCAYVAPLTLYRRAFALFWFYGLRPPADVLEPTRHFYANNIAFRRALFARHPYPDCRPRFRGHCAELAAALCTAGAGMYRQCAARVDHPPPNGWRHLLRRALCEGHDEILQHLQHGDAAQLRLAATARRWHASSLRALRRITSLRTEVGLAWWGVPPALAVAWTYYGLRAVGEVMTRVAPQFLRRHWAI